MFCIDNCSQLIKWALRNHQKWLSVLSAIGVLYILARFLGIYQFHVYRTGLINSGKQCYFREILPNADPNFYFLDVMPKGQLYGDSPAIFFHETSCANNLTANLTPRQACAVESAAKNNPDLRIFVIFTAPRGMYRNNIPPNIQALQQYRNIFFRNLELTLYVEDTQAEEWLATDELFESEYFMSHASDFFRYLTMYKYGGIYLDLDVIVQKSFDEVPPNFAGAESEDTVAAGVLHFAMEEVGRSMADDCLAEFMNTFNGYSWAHNGPGVITRVLHERCKTYSTDEMTPDQCQGFRVYSPRVFYPVPYWRSRSLFDTAKRHTIVKNVEESITVHFWNKMTAQSKLKRDNSTAYTILASRHCPLSYFGSDDEF